MNQSSTLEYQKNKDTKSTFSSNCVRLSGYELIFVFIVGSVLFYLVPGLWQRIEKFEPASDFRMPYDLSNDYWLYSCYCRVAKSKYDTLIIGDSVVWGHYVSRDNTLSSHLNKITGREQFANLGVDGTRPVVLAGLLKYYSGDISNKNFVLHFNPLWMSSSKQDLQTTKEFNFNHQKLAPQFITKIPCYKAPYSKRFSIVLERLITFLGWTNHLKTAYFDNMDIPTWTLEHPYKNPAGAITLDISSKVKGGQDEHTSWIEKGTAKKDFPWVELETSLQWKFFRQSVELLQERGNRVFVLVGPLNEHMLKGDSIEMYRKIKNKIEIWLQQNNIPFYIAPALPSELYADASHPFDKGYAMLAKQLFENKSFKSSILNSNSD
jgi:hypothetical protein